MHYLDIVLIIALLAFFIAGLRKGLVLSLLQLFAVVFIYIAIRQFGEVIAVGLCEKTGISETFAIILSYILLSVAVLIIIRIVAFLIKKLLKLIMLGWVDKVFGGIFGTIFGFFIIVLLVLVLELTSIAKHLGENRGDSKIYSIANEVAKELRVNISELYSP